MSVSSLMLSPCNGNVQRVKCMHRGLIVGIPSTISVSGLCGLNAWDAEGLVATRAQGVFRPGMNPRPVCLDPILATRTRQRLPLHHQTLRQERWNRKAMRRTLSHQRLSLEGTLPGARDTDASELTPPSGKIRRIGPASICQLPFEPNKWPQRLLLDVCCANYI